MKAAKLLSTLAFGCLMPIAALAAPTSPCPALNALADSTYVAAGGGCNQLITVAANGAVTVASVNPNPYEGAEDQYVGIVNNSASPISSLTLSGPTDLFGFEGDGITAYGIPGNASDPEGYGGPNVFFTNINGSASIGTVNFISSILANGGTGYFSLELAPSAGMFSVTGTTGGPAVSPEPASFLLLGTGIAGLAAALRRRLPV